MWKKGGFYFFLGWGKTGFWGGSWIEIKKAPRGPAETLKKPKKRKKEIGKRGLRKKKKGTLNPPSQTQNKIPPFPNQ